MSIRLPLVGLFLGCLSFLLSGGCSADDDYPLKVCVISGEDLGSMGEPCVHEHNGTIVKFCCEPCLDDFNEDPDKYLAKLKQ